ncbi:MAG: hypothetical protein ACRC9X_02250, partial [Bacteroidales bacterium]
MKKGATLIIMLMGAIIVFAQNPQGGAAVKGVTSLTESQQSLIAIAGMATLGNWQTLEKYIAEGLDA